MQEYKGFTGSNYDEDDAERARQGGFVHFQGNPESRDVGILKQIASNPSLMQLGKDVLGDTEKQKEFKRLDDIRNTIMESQNLIDMMEDEAQRKHPGIAEDFRNNTQNYKNDFDQMYPEYENIIDKLDDAQYEYAHNPFHDEHFQNIKNKLKR